MSSKPIAISKEVAEHYASLIPVYATQDSDGHWYVVPVQLKDEFDRLLDGGESTEDEFIEQFSQYMTGGDLNLTQLYMKAETPEDVFIDLAEDEFPETCKLLGAELEDNNTKPSDLDPQNAELFDPLASWQPGEAKLFGRTDMDFFQTVTPKQPTLPPITDDHIKASAIDIISKMLAGVQITSVERLIVDNFMQMTATPKPSALEMVEEFHEAFNCPVLKTPGIPDTMTDKNLSFYRDLCVILEEMKKHNDRSRSFLRVKLVFEEFLELYDALINGDIVEALDALSDILYVTYGTHHELGLGPIAKPAFAEVHRSNMSKLGADGRPIYRVTDGKVMKGPNFTPPDLAGVMERHFSKKDINWSMNQWHKECDKAIKLGYTGDLNLIPLPEWDVKEWRQACDKAIKEGYSDNHEKAEFKSADSVIGAMLVITEKAAFGVPQPKFPDNYERQVTDEQPPTDGNY